MAELNVGNLELTITADGSAAIRELESVGDAAEDMARGVEAAGREAGDGLEGVGEAARSAQPDVEGLGEAGEDAGERIGEGAEKAGNKLEDLGRKMSDIGSKASKFITLPIVGALGVAVKGASDLSETVSKCEVVFDRFSDRIMAWADSSIEAMGLAKGSALEYASTFGDMGKGMGLTTAQATDMSMSLTQLAADLASFKNISTETAASKLQGVFTGETQALKGLGIVMTQTNLEAFAMSQGITKSISDMSQAEQVMLRYQYVMSATADAQGDFARTGDSFANQTRKLGQTVKELGESFGSVLLPVITPIVEKISDFVRRIGELDERTKRIIISVGLVAAAIGPLLLVGGKLLTFVSTLKTALAALSINPIALGIGAVTAAIAGVVALSSSLGRAGERSERVTAQMERMREAVRGETTANIKIVAEDDPTGGVIARANALIAELTKPEYEGKIAIDGDPDKFDALIAKTRQDVASAEAVLMQVDADPQAAQTTIEALQEDINALEGAVVITDDPAEQAMILKHLGQLKIQLGMLQGAVRLSVGSDTVLEEARETLDALDGPEYEGKIAIDGNPANFRSTVAQIRADVASAEAVLMQVGADPQAAQTTIEALQADIEALEGAVTVTDDPAEQAMILKHLGQLKIQLGMLQGAVRLSVGSDTVLEEARATLDALDGPEYEGKIAIDGNPANFRSTVAQIRADVASAEAVLMQVGANPAAAQTAIEALQADIEALEGAVTITDDPEEQAQIQERIGALVALIGQLRQTVSIQAQFRYESDTTLTDIQAFKEQLTGLPKDETYRAVGSFELESAETLTDLEDYRAAMVQAATSTTEFREAVETMQDIVDRKLQEQIRALNLQAYADIETLALMRRSGEITEETYTQMGLQIAEAYNARIAELEARAEAAKRDVGVFANGSAADDLPGMLDMIYESTEGRTSATDFATANAAAQVVTDESAGDMERQVAALQMKSGYLQQAAEQQQALNAAVEAYAGALQDVNGIEAGVLSDDELEQIQGAMEQYMSILNSGQEAADAYGQTLDICSDMSDKAKTAFEALMTSVDESGNAAYASASDVSDFIDAIYDMNDAEIARAQQARENASQALLDAVTAAGDEQTYLTEEAARGAIEAIEAAGGELNDAEKEFLTGVPAAVQQAMQAAQAAVDNGTDPAEALAQAMEASAGSAGRDAATGGAEIGNAMMDGMIQGVRNRSGELANAMRAVVRAGINAGKAEGDIRSPSRVMRREVGTMLTRGLALGVRDEVPASLKVVRDSTRRLMAGMSGTAAVALNSAPTAAPRQAFDYEAMGEAMRGAMRGVRFGFSVGDRELAEAAGDANARQIAFLTRRTAAGVGG